MNKEKKSNPIGVFDSGLGGLTVVKEMMRQMPEESIVYFGDTARVPYGTKSRESIIRFSHDNTRILISRGVKMVVVACNSSSSYAINDLRKNFGLPILGVIEPGAKKAVAKSRKGRIGVIATSATINSGRYEREIKRLNNKVKVFNQACPLFVPLAEEGWFNTKISEAIARAYLEKLKKKNIDVLILGCTHYPLLKSVIKKVMGKDVELIDSAKEIAFSVREILEGLDLNNESLRDPKFEFLISDKPQKFSKIARKFLGREIKGVKYV